MAKPLSESYTFKSQSSNKIKYKTLEFRVGGIADSTKEALIIPSTQNLSVTDAFLDSFFPQGEEETISSYRRLFEDNFEENSGKRRLSMDTVTDFCYSAPNSNYLVYLACEGVPNFGSEHEHYRLVMNLTEKALKSVCDSNYAQATLPVFHTYGENARSESAIIGAIEASIDYLSNNKIGTNRPNDFFLGTSKNEDLSFGKRLNKITLHFKDQEDFDFAKRSMSQRTNIH